MQRKNDPCYYRNLLVQHIQTMGTMVQESEYQNEYFFHLSLCVNEKNLPKNYLNKKVYVLIQENGIVKE
jgi:hypothetical protein